MAEDLQFRITEAGGQTVEQRIRQLRMEMGQLLSVQQSYISGYRKFEGTAVWEAQYAAVQKNITAIRELSAAQQQVQRNMVAMNAAAAGRVEELLGGSRGASQIREIGSAFGKIEAEATNAGRGVGRMGQELRHTIALFDEFNRGQRGAMIASATALLRSTGIIDAAVSALTGPLGVMGAVGVAAFAAIAYSAEQAYQRIQSINTAAGEMGAHGFGDTTGGAAAQFDEWKARTNEYAGTIRKIQTESAGIQPAAQAVTDALERQSVALGALTKQDPAKVFEELAKAANSSPEALLELEERLWGLQGATDANGRSLKQQMETLVGLDAQFKFVADAVTKFRAAELAAGTESAKDKNSFWETLIAAVGLGDGISDTSGALDKLVGTLEKAQNPMKGMVATTQQLTANQRALNSVLIAGQTDITNRIELLKDLAIAESASGEAAAHAAALLSIQAERPAGPVEQRADENAAAKFQADMQAHATDLAAQRADIEKRIQDRTEVYRRRGSTLPSGQGLIKSPTDEELAKVPELIQLKNELAQKNREIARQGVQDQINAQQAIINNDMVGAQQRIAAQERINQLRGMKYSPELGGAPMFTPQEQAEGVDRAATLQRQAQIKSFQDVRDQTREAVELAKGNVDQIIAAYNRLRSAAQQTGQGPAVFSQINREEVRDLESAQSQKMAAVTEFNSAVEREDGLRIAANKASLGTQVAAHAMSKEEMAQKEAAFTASLRSEEEKRVADEINTTGITADQKEKLYQHLSELYARDAEEQTKANEQVTQAIEAENAKRIKAFTSMFDQFGSESERLVTNLLTGQGGRNPLRSFATSMIGSVVKGAGSLASEAAGGFIGPKLGLTDEQSKGGLGDVLGNALAKSLGLLKTPPKSAMDTTADKWTAAVQAQAEATKLQKEAAEELKKAGQALQGFKGGSGASASGSGAGAGGQFSSDSTAQAASLVRKYESGGNYNAGYSAHGDVDISGYPARPGYYGFPDWPGNRGPAGISHAAGAYQFEPDTWRTYAQKAGVSDFSPGSQDKVFAAAYGAEGYGPWSGNTRLMGAVGSGGSSSPGLPTSLLPPGGFGASGGATPVPVTVVSGSVGPGSPIGSIEQKNVGAPGGPESHWAMTNNGPQVLTGTIEQLRTQLQQQTTTIQQNAAAVNSSSQANQANTQDLNAAAQAATQFSTSAKQGASSIGGAGGGGGGQGLVGSAQSLTSQLSRVVPGLGAFSSVIGIAQGAVQLFSAATSAASATSAAGGAAKLGLGFLGLAGGTSSTPSGAILVGEQGPELLFQPGGLGVMNNRDTRSILSSRGGLGGGLTPGSMPNFPPPHFAAGTDNHSVSNSNMTYAPQITGRFGGMSRGEVNSILRSHGDAFAGVARNFIRNGAFGYG